MPGRDRKIDPVTRDYVKNGRGGYETTTTIATKVYHQLKGKRGTWWGDPDAGSDCHLIPQKGAGVGGIVFAKNAIRTALQRFVDQGLARDIEVEATSTASGRIVPRSSITDIQAGKIDTTGLTPFDT